MMSCCRLFVVVVLLGLPPGSLAQQLQVNEFVGAIQEIKRSITAIIPARFGDDGQLTAVDQIAGTGFFVNQEGHFLTAGHVIKRIQQKATVTPIILVPVKLWGHRETKIEFEYFEFNVIQIDERNDLALCKTVRNPFEQEPMKSFLTPVNFKEQIPADGTLIGFTGFPLDQKVPLSGRGMIASYQYVGRGDQRTRDLVVHSTSWPGVSGSPVFLRDGRVIGMVTRRGINRGIGLTYARPARLIKKFLQIHKVPY